MNVFNLTEEELYEVVEQVHNSPHSSDEKGVRQFQSEIKERYNNLVSKMSHFGTEGDYYGISDFSIRPDLRGRKSVASPPAPHVREFYITVLTQEFMLKIFLKLSWFGFAKWTPDTDLSLIKILIPSGI